MHRIGILVAILASAAAATSFSPGLKSLNGCDDICGIALEPGGKGDSGAVESDIGAAAETDADYYGSDYPEAARVEARKKKKPHKKKHKVEADDTRIVNGYEPEDRPWLVMINVEGGLCGGAIVSKR